MFISNVCLYLTLWLVQMQNCIQQNYGTDAKLHLLVWIVCQATYFLKAQPNSCQSVFTAFHLTGYGSNIITRKPKLTTVDAFFSQLKVQFHPNKFTGCVQGSFTMHLLCILGLEQSTNRLPTKWINQLNVHKYDQLSSIALELASQV